MSGVPGDREEFGVLGGGLCGLLVARELQKRGLSFRVLEKEDEPGGLARTVRFGRIPGDTGPHALYSHNPKVMDFFRSLPVRYDEHRRKVRVVHHGSDGAVHEVDYPFENGIGDLPLADRVDCLVGYVEATMKGRRDFAHLKDWIVNGLGYGIAGHFMVPYNTKIWNAPLTNISMDLVNKKIEPASVRTVIESALGIRTVGRRVQSVFLYPRGGIGAVTRALAKPLGASLELSTAVRRIRRDAGGYEVLTDRGPRRFRGLISTIPLKEFLRLQPFAALRRHRLRLAHNDTLFVAVSLEPGRRFARFDDCHWLFFAGPEIFYRVNMMHLFHRSRERRLVAEVTWKGMVRKLSPKEAERRVVRDLARAGILARSSDAAAVASKLVPFTYPIPTVGLPGTLARLDAELSRRRIHLLGRGGHWDYINMDMVVERVWRFFEKFPVRAK